MQNVKVKAGDIFPQIQVATEDGRLISLVDVESQVAKARRTLVIVYRGQHCPICLNYLNELELFTSRFEALDIDVVAVSADNKSQLQQFKVKGLNTSFPILLELQVEDMKRLGLYISEPTSDSETDHLFAEPGLFLVNSSGEMSIVEIANAPFIRPNIEQFVSGMKYVIENNYPIRGTHGY
ncbi:redoxin domain-containing protein [Paraglaciecola arctica]|uniref:Alkyl hydroperoxide reductase n=1 Tax=Paraglaciecola arctica BSs20135 TaxID=493475 RepID=K6YT65_9ALTE|nr:redoxin domain-containing protein [Paraglaciecola arctica]GAC19888.1 alkyl hydroperoxide reductase [Paraglaciecola arctica BSs20135]